MNIVQIASLAGIILCAIFLILLLIGSIAERIRARREIEKDEAYRASWSAWGDVTDLREA